MKCPKCENQLERWRPASYSYFNTEQQEAERAGDYYCTNCKGDRGKSGYRYYWESELCDQIKEADNSTSTNNDSFQLLCDLFIRFVDDTNRHGVINVEWYQQAIDGIKAQHKNVS